MATIIKHPEGNTLRMRIPLTERFTSLEGGQESTSYRDFIPNANYPVKVLFLKGSTKYELTASVTGNVVEVIDYGTIAKGVYAIEVLCRDENGDKRRYKQRAVLEVVDLTADAGIDAGVEFDVTAHYLDAAVFVTSGSQGGTVDQVQADWEQEDETAVDFIKNKPTIPTIPTNVSEFTNDAGYLTQHQDISGKVDKVTGKGLSTEDYTTAEKTKLEGLESLSPATATPQMDGTAGVGISDKYAREDHVHPSDTSKQDVINDLSTIRSGATAGATALQPSDVSVETPTNPDGTVLINVVGNTYIIDLNHTHPQYQPLLTEGANITIAEDQQTGNLVISASGGGSSIAQVQVDWNQTDTTAVDYIKNKPTIPVVPTNVSSFTNDAGYLTSHQSLAGRVQSSDVAQIVLLADEAAYNALATKDSNTLYLIPES